MFLCLYTQTPGVIKKNLLIFFSNNLAFSMLKMWILESKIAEINSQLHYSLCDFELIDWLWSSASSLPNDKILACTSQCCEAHRQDAAYRAWHTADNCSINANNNYYYNKVKFIFKWFFESYYFPSGKIVLFSRDEIRITCILQK